MGLDFFQHFFLLFFFFVYCFLSAALVDCRRFLLSTVLFFVFSRGCTPGKLRGRCRPAVVVVRVCVPKGQKRSDQNRRSDKTPNARRAGVPAVPATPAVPGAGCAWPCRLPCCRQRTLPGPTPRRGAGNLRESLKPFRHREALCGRVFCPHSLLFLLSRALVPLAPVP